MSRSVEAFGLLWFDASAGFKPPPATPAESALYRALGHQPGFPSVMPQLSPENVVLIGLREASPLEAPIVKGSRVTVFTIADIDALGMSEVLRQALAAATAGTRGFYVSYHPAVTDLPEVTNGAGGITRRETHLAMEIVARHGAMLAMDAVGLGAEAEPRLIAETTAFIMSCFGKQIL